MAGNKNIQRKLLTLMYGMPPDVFINFVYTYLCQCSQSDYDSVLAGLKLKNIGLIITPDNDIFINKEF